MVLTPEQQEELDALKKWWKENGLTLMATFIITATALFGWKFWQEYRISQQEETSLAFEQLSAVPEGADDEAGIDVSGINAFIKQHDGSGYTSLAALLAAKAHVEKEEYAEAEAQLRWTVEHSDKAQIKEIAQLRLARVLLAQGKHDAALSVANQPHDVAYAGLYAELRGDIHMAMDDRKQARANYEEAARYPEIDASILKFKMNQAGGRLN